MVKSGGISNHHSIVCIAALKLISIPNKIHHSKSISGKQLAYFITQCLHVFFSVSFSVNPNSILCS